MSTALSHICFVIRALFFAARPALAGVLRIAPADCVGLNHTDFSAAEMKIYAAFILGTLSVHFDRYTFGCTK
jgi:hypothetical protein